MSVFSLIDYGVMLFTFLSFTGIGLYYRFTGGRQKTKEEYLLGNRSMSFLPVAISLMASYMSAIAMLGSSAEYYNQGIQFILVNLSYLYAFLIAGYFYIPVFFGLQKLSINEYLNLRFGPWTRLVASLLYVFQQISYNGLVLFAPALTLEAVTGLDKNVSILFMGVVCTFYSAIGGIKAVVMTDILQTILMFAAIWMVIVFAAIEVGGFGNIWESASQRGMTNITNFSLDPTVRNTWWSVVFGAGFLVLTTYASNHTQIQRLLTMKNLRTSRLCLWASGPFHMGFSLSICFAALAMYAVFKDCDPVKNGDISTADQLLPYFVVTVMKKIPGMAGLFVAGIFSASLSTSSAGCNCLAAITISDYLPYVEKRFNISLSGTLATKIYATTYGILFMAMAFLAQFLGGLFQAYYVLYSMIAGPLFAVFTLGMFTTNAHEMGTLIGLFSGLIVTSLMGFGGPKPPIGILPPSIEGCSNITSIHKITDTIADTTEREYFYLYRISPLWMGVIGFVCAIVVGYLFSVLIHWKQPWERDLRETESGCDGLPNPNLFTPLLSSRVQERNRKIRHDRKLKAELLPLYEEMHRKLSNK